MNRAEGIIYYFFHYIWNSDCTDSQFVKCDPLFFSTNANGIYGADINVIRATGR